MRRPGDHRAPRQRAPAAPRWRQRLSCRGGNRDHEARLLGDARRQIASASPGSYDRPDCATNRLVEVARYPLRATTRDGPSSRKPAERLRLVAVAGLLNRFTQTQECPSAVFEPSSWSPGLRLGAVALMYI